MTKTHISLNVTDVQRAINFYSAFFGVSPHKIRPGYANFDLCDPPLKLALNEKAAKAPGGPLNHLGLQVESTDVVLATKQRLESAGLVIFDEMNTTCCYAKQDKIWVRDPDGNAWEVYVLTDDMLDDHHEEESGLPMVSMGNCCPA